jgi:pimeloyl-ACP methyl ester carboxylesterase
MSLTSRIPTRRHEYALGVRRVHIAGHSSSALIALQLTADRPDLVGTLVLMEPPLYFRLPGPARQAMSQRMAAPMQHYREGDREGAVDAFLSAVFGSGSRELLEHLLPGSFAQAVQDADIFFDIELPDMLLWPFGAVEARRITAPVLSLAGAESNPMFSAVEQLLREWLPQLETACVPEVNHLLQLQRPQRVAEIMAAYLARHSLR